MKPCSKPSDKREDKDEGKPTDSGKDEGKPSGGDISLVVTMTVAEAKVHANALPMCIGFTFQALPKTPESPVKIFFRFR